MTDRTPPKSKKSAKGTGKALPGPKLIAKDIKPGIGHNLPPHTGERNPEAVKCMDELIAFRKQKKDIAKAERDVRNRLKTEFGILASSVTRECALRSLDPDVRVQVQTNHTDFEKMLGYQPSLDFQGGVATSSSAKAQPPEAKLEERNTEPSRITGQAPLVEGFYGDDEDDVEQGGVITREG